MCAHVFVVGPQGKPSFTVPMCIFINSMIFEGKHDFPQKGQQHKTQKRPATQARQVTQFFSI